MTRWQKLASVLRRRPRPLILYNMVAAMASQRLHLARPLGRPFRAMIEPTNACNLRCPLCPTGTGTMQRPKGMMPLEAFRRIIGQLSPWLVQVQLFKDGEPFLHPNIYEMIAAARETGAWTIVSTNAHFFDADDKAEALVRAGLDELSISLDGCTQETYSCYRRGGQLARVLDGTRRIVEAKCRLGAAHPLIEFTFIVMRCNEHQIAEVHELGREIGVDEVRIKTLFLGNDLGASAWKDLLPTDDCYSRYRVLNGQLTHKLPPYRLCAEVWTDLTVNWNGDVVPCCYDAEGHLRLGNMLEQGLDEIWWGERYVSLRKRLREDKSSIPLCRECRPA